MHLEAFSVAKDPQRPERNEDRFGVRSGRYYLVIDGVTDKSGVPLPDGSSRGQEAGRLIARTVAALDDEGLLSTVPVAAFLGRLEETFQARYRELGELEAAAADPNFRYAAQLALAVEGRAGGPDAWRLLVIGDCGIRVDGLRSLGGSQAAEAVLAAWRGLVVRDVLSRGWSVEEALACGRHYCLEGTGRFEPAWEKVLSLNDWERLRAVAASELAVHLEGFPDGTLSEVLHGGVKGAARYRNDVGPLGQPCVDGFPVPEEKVVEERVAIEPGDGRGAASLELYTDGYFGTPVDHAARLADWEDHFARVEREDPYKIGSHPATKGSSPGAFTDDRTVLIVSSHRGRGSSQPPDGG